MCRGKEHGEYQERKLCYGFDAGEAVIDKDRITSFGCESLHPSVKVFYPLTLSLLLIFFLNETIPITSSEHAERSYRWSYAWPGR